MKQKKGTNTALVNLYTSEEFKDILKRSYSYHEFLVNLGYKSNSDDTYNIVKKRIEKEGLDTSHFGTTKKHHVLTREIVFKKDSDVSPRALRNWFLKEDIPYICSICGQEPFWNGKPLTLIMDHKDGNNRNNELSNLRWACPNCNQQFETTGHKAMRTQDTYHLKKKKEHLLKQICPICGGHKYEKSKICNSCQSKKNYIPESEMKVSREELKSLIKTLPFTTIAKKYDVSDNTIRKWCKKFNLPSKASEIKKISDEDWKNI